jgi:pilus assembly protein Flp/PilA
MLTLAMYKLQYLKNLLAREEGQDLIEYSLIIALIVIAAAASLSGIGDSINTIYEAIASWIGGIDTTP